MPLSVLSQVHVDKMELQPHGEWVIPPLLSEELSRTLILSSLTFPRQLYQPCFTSKDNLASSEGHSHGLQSRGIIAQGFTPSPRSSGAPCSFLPLQKQGSEGPVRSVGARRTPQCIEGLGSHPAVCRCWLPNRMFQLPSGPSSCIFRIILLPGSPGDGDRVKSGAWDQAVFSQLFHSSVFSSRKSLLSVPKQ